MNAGIEALFHKALQQSGVVGAQLSIFKDGTQIDLAHGLANVELGLPMTPDTVVQVGSVTKLFTALLAMSLVEEGSLDLDVPVKRYLSDFQVQDDSATHTLTTRHLLSMSSGLDNGDYAEYGSGEDAIARRVASLRDAPQHFTPGRYFGYSNASTDIVGHLAERITSMYWDDLLSVRVLERLELRNTVSLNHDRMFQRVSVGHALDPHTRTASVIRHPRWSMPRGTAPMGGTLTASARDLVRLGRLFLNRGVTDFGHRVYSAESIAQMMTPQISVPVRCTATDWCLGPCSYEWQGMRIWGHPGGNVSGGSYLYWIPELKAAMAWTINTVGAREAFERVMALEVMQAAFGVHKPDEQPATGAVSLDARRYVGTYTSLSGECIVSSQSDQRLNVTKHWRNFADPRIVDTEVFALVPVNSDRFLLDRGAHRNPLALPEDLAFFGDDGQGRATNLLNFVWPMSRRP